jgi:uncharacterized protein involved in exopolysaccharide biosynthesis
MSTSATYRAKIITIQRAIAELQEQLGEENKRLIADERLRDKLLVVAAGTERESQVAARFLDLIRLQEEIIKCLEDRLQKEIAKLAHVQDEFADKCSEEEEA